MNKVRSDINKNLIGEFLVWYACHTEYPISDSDIKRICFSSISAQLKLFALASMMIIILYLHFTLNSYHSSRSYCEKKFPYRLLFHYECKGNSENGPDNRRPW